MAEPLLERRMAFRSPGRRHAQRRRIRRRARLRGI